MTKYVRITADGYPAFYDSEIYGPGKSYPLPADAREISDEDYNEFFSNMAERTFDASGKLQVRKAPEKSINEIRAERDQLLAASDWTQLPDAPLTQAEKQAWAAYRQTLRDLPEAVVNGVAPKIPEPPQKARR